MTNAKRILVYVIPVTLLSFALNIPKFMEVTVTQNNGTNEVDTSQTRRDPTFIFWYTLSLIWHPTLTTGVLPFIGLVYMNMKIYIGIRQSRQVGEIIICKYCKHVHSRQIVYRLSTWTWSSTSSSGRVDRLEKSSYVLYKCKYCKHVQCTQ